MEEETKRFTEQLTYMVGAMGLVAALFIGVIIIGMMIYRRVGSSKHEITALINETNKNTANLSKLVKELSNNLKS